MALYAGALAEASGWQAASTNPTRQRRLRRQTRIDLPSRRVGYPLGPRRKFARRVLLCSARRHLRERSAGINPAARDTCFPDLFTALRGRGTPSSALAEDARTSWGWAASPPVDGFRQLAGWQPAPRSDSGPAVETHGRFPIAGFPVRFSFHRIKNSPECGASGAHGDRRRR